MTKQAKEAPLSLKEELILFSITHSHCFVDFAGLENMGASHRRNELAHWEQLVYTTSEPGRRVVLVPPAMNPENPKWKVRAKAKMGDPPAYAIGVRRMHEILYQIATARLYLLHFFVKVAHMKTNRQPPPTLLQSPTLDEIVKDFRKQLASIGSD